MYDKTFLGAVVVTLMDVACGGIPSDGYRFLDEMFGIASCAKSGVLIPRIARPTTQSTISFGVPLRTHSGFSPRGFKSTQARRSFKISMISVQTTLSVLAHRQTLPRNTSLLPLHDQKHLNQYRYRLHIAIH